MSKHHLCTQFVARRARRAAQRAHRQALSQPTDLCWSCNSRPINKANIILCDECCPLSIEPSL